MCPLSEGNERKRRREENENSSEMLVRAVNALKLPPSDSDVSELKKLAPAEPRMKKAKSSKPEAAQGETLAENAELEVAWAGAEPVAAEKVDPKEGQAKLEAEMEAEQEVEQQREAALQGKAEIEAAEAEAVAIKADQLEKAAQEAIAEPGLGEQAEAERGKTKDDEAGEQPEAAVDGNAETEAVVGGPKLTEALEVAEQEEAKQGKTGLEEAAMEAEAVVAKADHLEGKTEDEAAEPDVEAAGAMGNADKLEVAKIEVLQCGVGNCNGDGVDDIGDAELEEWVESLIYKGDFYLDCLEEPDDSFSIAWDEFEVAADFWKLLEEEEEDMENSIDARNWCPFEEEEMKQGRIWYAYTDAELRSFGVFDDKEGEIAWNNDFWNFDDIPKP